MRRIVKNKIEDTKRRLQRAALDYVRAIEDQATESIISNRDELHFREIKTLSQALTKLLVWEKRLG